VAMEMDHFPERARIQRQWGIANTRPSGPRRNDARKPTQIRPIQLP